MKFHKQLLRNMVAEWTSEYIQYKQLKDQIKKIQAKALSLASAFANIRGTIVVSWNSLLTNIPEITDTDLEPKIELPKLKDNAEFWRMLDEQLASVNAFYQKQEEQMAAQFQTLTIHALKLVSEYSERFDTPIFNFVFVYRACSKSTTQMTKHSRVV